MRTVAIFALGLSSLAFSGCFAPTETETDVAGDSEGESEDEALGEAEQALGEISCATGSFDAIVNCPLSAVNATCTSTSPNSDYGWEVDGCPGQWSADWQNVPDSPITVRHSAEWAGTALTTQALCLSARMTVAGYRYNENGGMFSLAGTAKVKGSWSNGTCTFVSDGGGPTSVIDSLTCFGNPVVCKRLASTAVKAWRTGGIFGTQERVRARVTRI